MSREEVFLNSYSDDSKSKEYINNVLMPRVFNDIPLNVLNTGMFSIISEYMSQSLEQQAFTSAFYFNESFITKAVLPDSIYAEAAIFNIGYSFAIPSLCNILLELRIKDIYKNAKYNADNGLYEFILDKDTKINLKRGNTYSLDYDILIQFKDEETSSVTSDIPAWNVQYINTDTQNSIAKNKETYIVYRVTETWLCLFIKASEYTRETHTVINNMTNITPTPDKVITCTDHICGFDVKLIDIDGKETWIDKDHVLPIHSNVTDDKPYIHYIMDNPQTIRFMFQLNGSKYYIPASGSRYEITMYTCHGVSANFDDYNNESEDGQPSVISSSIKYYNNASVLKAAFILPGGSQSGTDIGSAETVRRETIEAYNTANVISSDHDIDEWFKTFYFKNVLYPYFFKRRDDPWGRIWSGFLALKDDDDYVFRTNTLLASITYDELYHNNDNSINSNEIIIPPGWLWVYGKNDQSNRYTVYPYTKSDNLTIETAKTLANIDEKFVFANPFGIRIQKDPFAIGYFNPWIDEYVTTTRINSLNTVTDDLTMLYHATPTVTNIKRTYRDDYYALSTRVFSPSGTKWLNGEDLVEHLRQYSSQLNYPVIMWNYFNKPRDAYAPSIPILPLSKDDGYLPYDPERTYLCVKTKNRDGDRWVLNNLWIQDQTNEEIKNISLPITGLITSITGEDYIWGDEGLCKGYEVYVSGETDINVYPKLTPSDTLTFDRIETQNYYEMKLSSTAQIGDVDKIIVTSATETSLTKYSEEKLIRIGLPYSTVYINVYFQDGTSVQYTIMNAANVYTPYEYTKTSSGEYEFDLSNVGHDGIVLYAEMKPSPEAGAIDYYRVPLSLIEKNSPLFYVNNTLVEMDKNNMRVILHAMVNGVESGMVEMEPVSREADGVYKFEATMYPLNELIDIDNRIMVASTKVGGGSWISPTNSSIPIDAVNPEFKISILVKTLDETHETEIKNHPEYTGYRVVDSYKIDDISLIQELKEMRSVVEFGDAQVPTENQMTLYNNLMSLNDSSKENTLYDITEYAYAKINSQTPVKTFDEIKSIAIAINPIFLTYMNQYRTYVDSVLPSSFADINNVLDMIIKNDDLSIDYEKTYNVLFRYGTSVNEAFVNINVNGGLKIHLVPFIEYTTMTSDRFESFVKTFVNVHKSIEPVIMQRLEGNNYLDCKLLATYGLPHSYVSDIDYRESYDNNLIRFWSDLNIQIEFDVKLYNQTLSTNTINELKTIIKSYFNRITTIHTPVDAISMDNNIYISHVIQQLEEHPNVAYLKFKGWYTNDPNSYLDANYQGIVQAWKRLEEFPKHELERFVPEMFVLENDNIKINII